MNLLRLITREEIIGGLDVSDSALRLALLEVPKKEQIAHIRFLLEEPLPEGVVANGALIKPDEFTKALQALLKKAPEKIRFAIVSLPPDQVYARVFSFPGNLRGDKLEESMKLTVGFQLPVQPKDVYLDWQSLDQSEESTVFLATLSREVAHPFLDAIAQAGLRTVALEYHPLSLSRTITLPRDETVLLTMPTQSSLGIFILKNFTLQFSRIIPRAFFSESTFSEEVRKVQDFYESQRGPIDRVVHVEDAEIVPAFSQHPETQKDPSKWLVSLGSAMRGLVPRAQDSLISLMPIGTEQAYEYQKALAFASFLSNITIALSIFFAAAFLGTWIFMSSLQQRTSDRIDALSALPIPADATTLEEQARHFNDLVQSGKAILDVTPHWSPVIEGVLAKIPPGIVISAATFSPALTSPVMMSGVATNRAQLAVLKKNMNESDLFTNIQIPSSNFELKENIPFTMSLELKDPQKLYR